MIGFDAPPPDGNCSEWLDARFKAVAEAEDRFMHDKATRLDCYIIGSYAPWRLSQSGKTIEQADSEAAQRGEPENSERDYNRLKNAHDLMRVREWHRDNGTLKIYEGTP